MNSSQLLCKCQGLEQVASGGQTSLLLSPWLACWHDEESCAYSRPAITRPAAHTAAHTHSATLSPTAQLGEAGWGWRGHSERSPLWGPSAPATVCPAVCPSTHLWTPPSPDVCEVGTEPGLLMQLSLSSGSLSLSLLPHLSASISKYQGASRAAPGKSGLHARGEGERVLALESRESFHLANSFL